MTLSAFRRRKRLNFHGRFFSKVETFYSKKIWVTERRSTEGENLKFTCRENSKLI